MILKEKPDPYQKKKDSSPIFSIRGSVSNQFFFSYYSIHPSRVADPGLDWPAPGQDKTLNEKLKKYFFSPQDISIYMSTEIFEILLYFNFNNIDMKNIRQNWSI